MLDAQLSEGFVKDERRRHPRYDVLPRVSLAVDDESLGESIGIGEAGDISFGGLRVRHLPSPSSVRLGHLLELLLIGEEQALSLRGEVVHHGTEDSFGIEFRDLDATERQRVNDLLRQLHR